MGEFNITKEQEAVLIANREKSKYLFRPENCSDYPIPELTGSRTVMLDAEHEGASFTWLMSRFGPKSSYHNKHSHPMAEELMYIAKGKGIGGVGDVEILVKEGDTLYVPAGVVHWFWNPYDEACDMMTLYTKDSLAAAGYALESGEYKEIGKEVEESWTK